MAKNIVESNSERLFRGTLEDLVKDAVNCGKEVHISRGNESILLLDEETGKHGFVTKDCTKIQISPPKRESEKNES